MPEPNLDSLIQSAESILATLQNGWNTADGALYATPFASDADFVNVYGHHAQGRETIAANHDHIFRTVYAGSRVEFRLKSARLLCDTVALIHVNADLSVPQGPMAGQHAALPSCVLTYTGNTWQIAALHNTFVRTPTA